MSNDTMIFFDDNSSNDGMLFLGGTTQDDDFLGGLGLAKKNKEIIHKESSNETDDTAIAQHKTDTTEIDTQTSEKVEDSASSLDAMIVRKAEPKTAPSDYRSFQQANSRGGANNNTRTNNIPDQKKKFSISNANKVTFEQGKISKIRYETIVPEVKPAISTPQTQVIPSAADHATREDRRRLATGNAVVFNRGGGGQKVTTQHQQPKRSNNTQTDYKVSQTISKKDEIVVSESVTVKEFAEKMGVPIAEVIKKFIANKMLLSLNSSIDYDTAALIAMEFDIKVTRESTSAGMHDLIEGNLQAILDGDKLSATKETRPPIVTIMGHVDHGKTTLLDYLRKTKLTSKEHGGITQSIGGSQIIHNGQKVTFIDTPGHALFTSLRARGAKITDIVVIVVAADDGIMKQTVEAINHAKDAHVPIIVAITKIDKGIDNSDFIKTQLSENGLTPEERGGDVPIVKVSSLTGQGIDDLMDQILLHAEVSELICDPMRNGIGVILEAFKDIQKGVIANMIVMTGTIKVGDILRTYDTFGKIKKIYNWKGQEIKQATGGDPVMILGINDVPEAGKLVEVVKDEKSAKSKIATVISTKVPTGLGSLINKIAEGEMTQANLLIKADSRGSLEALKQAIAQIDLPENISFKIIHSDIGNFFDSDLDLAKAGNALLIGFGISMSTMIKAKVDQMGISMKTFNIIYEITDYLEALAKGLIKHDPIEVQIGKLKLLAVFYRKGNETIFGGRVMEGEIRTNAYFRIIRGDEIIDSGKITSLQKGQENASTVATGYECGMRAKISKKPEYDDIFEFYVME